MCASPMPLVRRTRSANALPQGPAQLPPIPPHQAESALYWDYENTSLGKLFPEDAVSRLLNKVGTYGRLVECRLYADSRKSTLNPKHRSALENAGVTLIDCPTSNKREAEHRIRHQG